MKLFYPSLEVDEERAKSLSLQPELKLDLFELIENIYSTISLQFS